ncbi:MAG: diaminopimelate epimerase [Alphaproteobacteria bacterium]
MANRPFIKMHGLGNDFVVIDARRDPFEIAPTAVRHVTNRHTGIGCDQLIVLEPPQHNAADFYMRILSHDGSEPEACGNATRCVAMLVMDETGKDALTIQTPAGLLATTRQQNRQVQVDMGPAGLDWDQIPLAEPCDTRSLDISLGPLAQPTAVNIGNPHAVFFVEDVAAIDLETLGPQLREHPIFPQGANIGIAQILAPDRIRLRVCERGAGITLACGSGSCAAAVAAHRRGLTSRHVEVVLDGGSLNIEWRRDGHVLMTGPATISFTGALPDVMLTTAPVAP